MVSILECTTVRGLSLRLELTAVLPEKWNSVDPGSDPYSYLPEKKDGPITLRRNIVSGQNWPTSLKILWHLLGPIGWTSKSIMMARIDDQVDSHASPPVYKGH